MRLTRFCFICFLLIAIIFPIKSKAQTLHTFSGWAALFSTITVSKKLSIHFDGQFRSNDNWQQFQTIILRPGLNYKINDRQVATVGYAYVQQVRAIDGVSNWEPEHRLYEQYSITQNLPIDDHANSLRHRFRLEQRFLPKVFLTNNGLSSDGYNFSQRIRYYVKDIFPLQKSLKFEKGLFVSLQDEIMFNLGDVSVVNDQFFDQNRIYISVGYRLSSKMDIESGFMNQFIAGKGALSTSNNVIQMAIYFRL